MSTKEIIVLLKEETSVLKLFRISPWPQHNSLISYRNSIKLTFLKKYERNIYVSCGSHIPSFLCQMGQNNHIVVGSKCQFVKYGCCGSYFAYNRDLLLNCADLIFKDKTRGIQAHTQLNTCMLDYINNSIDNL